MEIRKMLTVLLFALGLGGCAADSEPVPTMPDATPECGDIGQACCPILDPGEDVPCNGFHAGACVDGRCVVRPDAGL